MNRRTRLMLSGSTIAGLMVLALLMSACAPPATPAPETVPDAAPAEMTLLEKVKDTKSLVVGTGSYPPNTFVDPATGEWVGFDMDFLIAFAEHLGVDPFITYMPASALVPALKSERIDIWVDLYYTEERAKELDFSDVWTCYTDAVVVNSETSTVGAPTVDELTGKTIATCRGCAEEAYIDAVPDANKALYDTVEETFLEVSAGRIDAAFQPLIYVEWGIQQNPDWNIEVAGLVPTDLIPGGSQLTASYYGVKKGSYSESFLAELNSFLQEWRSSGNMQESFAQYGLTDETFFLPTCELQ